MHLLAGAAPLELARRRAPMLQMSVRTGAGDQAAQRFGMECDDGCHGEQRRRRRERTAFVQSYVNQGLTH